MRKTSVTSLDLVVIVTTAFVAVHSLMQSFSIRADEPVKSIQTHKELQQRLFTLKTPGMPLKEVLSELCRQTGNVVVDRRSTADELLLKLDLKQVSFWQVLEEIAQSVPCRVSLYQSDGQIALTDGQGRKLPATISGLFQFRVKRLDLSRDEETLVRSCHIQLEVGWEPRFQPFYLEVGPTMVVYAADRKSVV